MRFSIYQESKKGGRKVNQDRMGYLYTRDSLLMLVCDGMGGHARGEVAEHDLEFRMLGDEPVPVITGAAAAFYHRHRAGGHRSRRQQCHRGSLGFCHRLGF